MSLGSAEGRPARSGHEALIAVLACAGILAHLGLRWGADASSVLHALARRMPLAAVLNALRAAVPGGVLSDYEPTA